MQRLPGPRTSEPELAVDRRREQFEKAAGGSIHRPFSHLHAVAVPANRLFLMMAWMPQLPSTTWVTPKSTPTEISEIPSSSVSPLVVIRKPRILRNASRSARSIEDFL